MSFEIQSDSAIQKIPAVQQNQSAVFASKYEILSVLGSGGMGTVYKARHTMMNRVVAIKVVHPNLATGIKGDKFKERFQMEANMASRLRHKSAVTVHDFGIENGVPFLVMEFIQGVSLRAVLEDGPLPLNQVFEIASQIGSALEEAHLLGIIHRDLKPENILISPSKDDAPRATVLDFGLAKIFDTQDEPGANLTRTGEILGTPGYMPPEHIRGGTLDPRTDIYSLGVMLYEMITGSLPFTSSSPAEAMAMHLSFEPEPPSSRRPDILIPGDIDDIIIRCLAKSPAQRPQSITELLRELETACNVPAKISTKRIAPAKPIQRGILKSRKTALALFFVFIAATISWQAYQSHSANSKLETAAIHAQATTESLWQRLLERKNLLAQELEETKRKSEDYQQLLLSSPAAEQDELNVKLSESKKKIELLQMQQQIENQNFFEGEFLLALKDSTLLANKNVAEGEFRLALESHQKVQSDIEEALLATDAANSAFDKWFDLEVKRGKLKRFADFYKIGQPEQAAAINQQLATVRPSMVEMQFGAATKTIAQIDQLVDAAWNNAEQLAAPAIEAARLRKLELLEAEKRYALSKNKMAEENNRIASERRQREQTTSERLRQLESGARIVESVGSLFKR